VTSNVLVLVCGICRWRPPGDLEMSLVESHFDLEPDHDPGQIQLEMVAWCHRCDLELALTRNEPLASGAARHHYDCPRCHRSYSVIQNETGSAATS